jgi:hypothetical protein
MPRGNELKKIPEIQKAIVNVLEYFDFFQHSLYPDEIHKYLSLKASKEVVFKNLEEMLSTGYIFTKNGLWALNTKSLDVRLHNLKRNTRLLKISKRMGWLIRKFPFVKGVYLSGSLSKLGANSDADIDYFIVTKNNRAWSARLFLTAFKKIFLLNNKRYFCINFFLDENHLELNKKNIYTAIESASLIAIHNKGLLGKFYEKNGFIQEYFPNFIPQKAYNFNYTSSFKSQYDPLYGTTNEIANDFFGNWREKKAQDIFKKRLSIKFNGENGDSEISDHASGIWPNSVQNRVLNNYNEKKLV